MCCQIRETAQPILIGSIGLWLNSFLIERGTLLADLDVDMLVSEHGLLSEFAHRPTLFEREMIDSLMSQYGAILRTAAREPKVVIANLSRCTLLAGARA